MSEFWNASWGLQHFVWGAAALVSAGILMWMSFRLFMDGLKWMVALAALAIITLPFWADSLGPHWRTDTMDALREAGAELHAHAGEWLHSDDFKNRGVIESSEGPANRVASAGEARD